MIIPKSAPKTLSNGQNLTRKTFSATVKSFDEGAQTCDYLVTTASLDRDEEICLPSGAQFFAYEANPIFLWGHDYAGGPERCLGKTLSWMRVAEGWVFRVWFDIQSNPQAKLVFGLTASGCLRAVSIGFIPISTVTQWSRADEIAALPDDVRALLIAGICRCVYTAFEIIELSAVHIGSNRDALARAVSAETILSKSLSEFLRKEFGTAREIEAMASPQEKGQTEISPEKLEAIKKAVADKVQRAAVVTGEPAEGKALDAKAKYFGYSYHPKVADIASRLYSVAGNFSDSVDNDLDGDIDDVSKVPDYVEILTEIISAMQALKVTEMVTVPASSVDAPAVEGKSAKGKPSKDMMDEEDEAEDADPEDEDEEKSVNADEPDENEPEDKAKKEKAFSDSFLANFLTRI